MYTPLLESFSVTSPHMSDRRTDEPGGRPPNRVRKGPAPTPGGRPLTRSLALRALPCTRPLKLTTLLSLIMSTTIGIKIKHAGKSYDVDVDMAGPALAFKEQIFQLTGVEVAKVKVVVKGGMLKVCLPVELEEKKGGAELSSLNDPRTTPT